MMIQILCFCICPLLAVFMFEKVNHKKFSTEERVLLYALMLAAVNLLCAGAITLLSGNGGFRLGDGSVYTARFVFKYLIFSLAVALIVLPYGYKIWKSRKEMYERFYTVTEYKLSDREERWKTYWSCNKAGCIAVSLSFLFFLFLMLYHLTYSALWGDEWVEFSVSQKEIWNGEMYQSVITTFQPPLYNWLMHFWLEINSDGVLWFRLFNVVLGMISGVFLYRTQLKNFGSKALGCASLLALGLAYHWIFAVQECSEYTLMLTALFAAIYFYSAYKKSGGLFHESMFVLACIAAMYSQYGAFFVVGPLLTVHLAERFFLGKQVMKKLRTSILYLCGLIFFALPLYQHYLRLQIQNNRIAAYSELTISAEEWKGLLTQFGQNIGFIWNLNRIDSLNGILSYLWLPFTLALIYILRKKYKGSPLLPLTLALLLGYVIHYFLTVMHIYAMVHANESSGFYSRYSFFYIPIFAVVLPAGVYVLLSVLPEKLSALKRLMAAALLAGLFVLAWPPIQQNWHKAYDDIYAEIWMERKGYEEPTYLTGACYWDAFNYYVADKYGTGYKEKVYDASTLDPENLPSAFWLWRTNWGGAVYDDIYAKAEEEGYEIEVFYERGLARFSREDADDR